jgi:hypothetical protein
MASTPDVLLADFSRYHNSLYRPASVATDVADDNTLREAVVTRSCDVEDVWQTDENGQADIGEREQVNLPRADGGTEAWLFLCGCFIIEALVWGRFSQSLIYVPTPMALFKLWLLKVPTTNIGWFWGLGLENERPRRTYKDISR